MAKNKGGNENDRLKASEDDSQLRWKRKRQEDGSKGDVETVNKAAKILKDTDTRDLDR